MVLEQNFLYQTVENAVTAGELIRCGWSLRIHFGTEGTTSVSCWKQFENHFLCLQLGQKLLNRWRDALFENLTETKERRSATERSQQEACSRTIQVPLDH